MMLEDSQEFKKAVGELHDQIVQQIAPHVLVVDDSEEDVIVLRYTLMKKCPHIHIQWRNNAEEAISCVRAFSYDLVILDLRMGLGMDGIGIFKAIRQNSLVPVIGLTGMDDKSSLVQEAIVAGMDVIFRKPLSERAVDLLFGTPGVATTAQEESGNDTDGN